MTFNGDKLVEDLTRHDLFHTCPDVYGLPRLADPCSRYCTRCWKEAFAALKLNTEGAEDELPAKRVVPGDNE